MDITIVHLTKEDVSRFLSVEYIMQQKGVIF